MDNPINGHGPVLNLTNQQSFYTVPAAWVLSIAPHFYAASLGGKSFDNRSPRTYLSSVKDTQALDATTKQRIIRAEGAQQNGFENVGLFAAAVVAANSMGFLHYHCLFIVRRTRANHGSLVAKVDNWTLNALSGGYLVSRLVYNLIYVNNESESLANARTATFLSGIGMIFTLFIKSGNALRNHL